jgi:lactate dehydrogenase-like 2-hydroxyacid dehydrogenase
MEILYFNKFDYPEYEKKYQCKKVSLNEILKFSDSISINLPYQPKLYHLISEKQLKLMKKEAFLINIARGPYLGRKSFGKSFKKS